VVGASAESSSQAEAAPKQKCPSLLPWFAALSSALAWGMAAKQGVNVVLTLVVQHGNAVEDTCRVS